MATKTKSGRTAKRTGGKRATAGRATRKRGTATRMSSRTSRVGALVTTDHGEIRRWAEERGGVPATVRGTERRGEVGVIRIDFPDGPEPKLEHIEWDEWFRKFDENQLAFLYQEKTATGKLSRFNKLVKRETIQGGGRGRAAGATARAAGARTAA